MVKKILGIILILCLIVSLIACSDSVSNDKNERKDSKGDESVADENLVAYPVEGGNLYFDPTTGAVTGCDASVFLAELPSEIEGVSVRHIGDESFSECSLALVSIPDGVETIGDRAFYGCGYLSICTIPDSVTSIGESAFYCCNSLRDFSIPNRVESIGAYAFYGCELREIDIPATLTSIGAGAFSCNYLYEIRVDKDNDAFCTDEYGVLYDRSRTVLIRAPRGLDDEYTIPDSVTTIDDGAFSRCRIATMTIPENVTSIGEGASFDCWQLDKICVETGNRYYCADASGVLFDRDQTTLLQAPVSLEGAYEIPDSVVTIGEGAFSSCDSLTSVNIPDSVTEIGRYAFGGLNGSFEVDRNNRYYSADECGVLFNKDKTILIQASGSLVDYSIPDSVTAIGEYAFVSCWNLESITIPDSVTSIGAFAFFGCDNLTSVTIPDSVTEICDSAFMSAGLTFVSIPDSVVTIGAFAFYCCDSMTTVTLGRCVEKIDIRAFMDCESLEEIRVDERNAYYSGDESGALLSKDKTVLIQAPSTIREYTVPEEVSEIGAFSFASCENLEDITIPSGVRSISPYAAFAHNGFDSRGTCFWVDENNRCYSNDEYGGLFDKDKTTLLYASARLCGEYHIPDSVTKIEAEAFWRCYGLETITIPDGVTELAASTFYDCENLKSVVIGRNVRKIDHEVFSGCDDLEAVYFLGDAPECEADAFCVSELDYPPDMTMYYIEGKAGWTSPTWGVCDYPTATWSGE